MLISSNENKRGIVWPNRNVTAILKLYSKLNKKSWANQLIERGFLCKEGWVSFSISVTISETFAMYSILLE